MKQILLVQKQCDGHYEVGILKKALAKALGAVLFVDKVSRGCRGRFQMVKERRGTQMCGRSGGPAGGTGTDRPTGPKPETMTNPITLSATVANAEFFSLPGTIVAQLLGYTRKRTIARCSFRLTVSISSFYYYLLASFWARSDHVKIKSMQSMRRRTSAFHSILLIIGSSPQILSSSQNGAGSGTRNV